jgi:hypothetical protein
MTVTFAAAASARAFTLEALKRLASASTCTRDVDAQTL